MSDDDDCSQYCRGCDFAPAQPLFLCPTQSALGIVFPEVRAMAEPVVIVFAFVKVGVPRNHHLRDRPVTTVKAENG